MSKTSPGTLLVFIFAVLFGLLGAYIVRKNLQPKPVAEVETKPPQPILVPRASARLHAGRQIALGDIALHQMTPEQMKAAGITKAFMGNTNQIIGRVLKQDLAEGETFDSSVLYPEGTGPNVLEKLQPGMRAVTVTVESTAAVEGFAAAGTWVDVLFRSEERIDEDHPETTVTLVAGAEVLALNRETFAATAVKQDDPRRDKKVTVTLAVTPAQAAALRVADGRGTMTLTLRHPEDDAQTVANLPKTLDDVLRIRNTKHRIEVYRGHQLSNIDFKHEDRLSPTEPQVAKRPTLPALNGPQETIAQPEPQQR